MDRAVLIGQGRTLNVAAALGQGVLTANAPAPRTAQASSGVIAPLDDVIRRHIEAALHQTRGRVEGPHGAARLLKINPHTLRARMRKLRINWRGFRMAGESAFDSAQAREDPPLHGGH